MGMAVANHILWIDTNPNIGLLPYPKSYRIIHLLSCHIFPLTALKMTILVRAGCGSCQSDLVV
jgi:hypothetical protein